MHSGPDRGGIVRPLPVEPQLLEVGDVPQVPDHGAQDGHVLAAQRLPVEHRSLYPMSRFALDQLMPGQPD